MSWQTQDLAVTAMRPVVFLDIDDVLCVSRTLNTRQVLDALSSEPTLAEEQIWQQIFHVMAVENLRQVDHEFNPWYVISSSWTLHLTKEQLCATFNLTGLKFVAGNLHVHWCTSRHQGSNRHIEIETWLDTHHRRGSPLRAASPFVIIDDVLSGQSLVGTDLQQQTVLCDATTGFLYPQLQAARQILNAVRKKPALSKDLL